MFSISRAMRRLGNKVISRTQEATRRRSRRILGDASRGISRRPMIEGLESRQLLTAVYPEIDLRGNGQSITNNDASPSTADFTDFGNADVVSGTVTRAYVIANTGLGVLNLTAATRFKLSGANAADFAV